MTDSNSRNSFLRVSILILIVIFSSCLSTGHKPGTLIINNERDEPYKVTVIVEKTSPNNMTERMKAISKAKRENNREEWLKQNTDNQSYNQSFSQIKPVWTKESTFTVNTKIAFMGGKIVKENFINETGIFYIEVQLEKIENGKPLREGEKSASTILTPGKAAGGGIAGPPIIIDIMKNGRLSVYTPFND